MTNTLKYYVLGGIVGVIVGLIASLFLIPVSTIDNTPTKGNTNYGGDLTVEALTVNGALTQTGAVTFTSTATANGKITSNAGHLRSYSIATTTTATTQTLAVADILNYDVVSILPNVGSLTLTFPASSTMTTLVPTAGDMQETCFLNATTTSGITITFAASTGIDLESASSTPSDLTITANGTACFKFIRQRATASAFDITAAMTEYMNAD